MMRQRYQKPPLSFDQQLEQLINRGLKVNDKAVAISKLSSISYYRLSAYWYPFRQRNSQNQITDVFVQKSNFNDCLKLYELDRKLRLLILDAIERIEVAIRTQVTYCLAHAYGTFGHADPKNFYPGFHHQEWINDIEKEILRSRDEFIVHYKTKYEGFPTIPLWMLTEVMSLGNLSKLYTGMKNDDKKVVAKHFNLHYKRLADWLHTLTYIRNICAHHSRLWNRELGIRPEKSKEKEWLPPLTPRNDRIFYILLIIRVLLDLTNNDESWVRRVNQLLEPFETNISYRAAMGIPENWKQHPIWRIK